MGWPTLHIEAAVLASIFLGTVDTRWVFIWQLLLDAANASTVISQVLASEHTSILLSEQILLRARCEGLH